MAGFLSVERSDSAVLERFPCERGVQEPFLGQMVYTVNVWFFPCQNVKQLVILLPMAAVENAELFPRRCRGSGSVVRRAGTHGMHCAGCCAGEMPGAVLGKCQCRKTVPVLEGVLLLDQCDVSELPTNGVVL